MARVERALKPLEGILKLRDTKEIHTAQQVMQVLLRFCSNTTLTFFLRAMPPSVTLPAAERHDELIDTALYKLVGGARVGAAGTCWERARKQARLPVKMGGMGLTSAVWTFASRRGLARGRSSPGPCASCMLLSATST